jgi:hypothetical protein
MSNLKDCRFVLCKELIFFFFWYQLSLIYAIVNENVGRRKVDRVFYNILLHIVHTHTHIKLEVIYFSPMIKSINEKSFKVNLRSCDYSVCWWEAILWVWLLFSLVLAFLLHVFFINCSNYTASVTVKKGKNNEKY